MRMIVKYEGKYHFYWGPVHRLSRLFQRGIIQRREEWYKNKMKNYKGL